MNTLEAIRTRRSIRAYQSKPIPADVLREILTAAMYAPSAGDAQPWQFVVINDRATMEEIPALHPNAEMAAQAGGAVLVCGDLRLEKYPGNWVSDCSAAIQNLMLAAHDQGIGTVWTAIYADQQRVEVFQKRFGLPAQVIPLALIVMGYGAEQPATPSRYREDRIHHNKW